MSNKKPITDEQLNEIIKALENHNVEQDFEVFFDEKTSFISVEDYPGNKVSASYDFYADDAKSSAPTPGVQYTINVAGFTFIALQDYDEIDEWEFDSDEYFISDFEWDELQDLLNDVVKVVDPYDYGDYPTSLSEEWSKGEVVEEIKSQLNHDNYIEFDDKIFPIKDTVQGFIDDYNSEHGTNYAIGELAYTLLTPQEVAERLTDEIYY